jgi:tyrosine-protein phosphatase 2/3
VVWQQDVRVIVMLTAEKEGGQVKAHNYWSDGVYGNLKLQFLSEHRASLEPSKIQRHRDRQSLGQRRQTIAGHRGPSQERMSSAPSANHKPSQSRPINNASSPTPEQPYVSVRKFVLCNTQDPFARPRELTQLQYSSWPDFGAPAHPAHLLGLVEQCDTVVRSSQGYGSGEANRPILVHCSAGCGRTGTFCTVDTAVDLLRKQMARREKQGRGWTTAEDTGAVPMELDGTPKSQKTTKPVNGSTSNPFDRSISQRNWPKNEEELLQRDDVDLIETTVEVFRLQRLSMVQSLRQFVLCYESILEWICEQQPRTA